MIQVIERFHKLLEYISEEPQKPRSLSELAEVAGVSVQACSNIVRTMVKLRYLDSPGARKGFVLGSELYFLTRKEPFKKYLAEVAEPFMSRLSREINEFIVLVAECAGKRYELLHFEADSMVRVFPGHSSVSESLFRTSTGILILAHKSETEFHRFWECETAEGRGAFRDLDYTEALKKCAKIVADGFFIYEPYAKSEEERLNSLCTMAFPVFENGRISGALGARIPLFRFSGVRRETILRQCRETADRISREISL